MVRLLALALLLAGMLVPATLAQGSAPPPVRYDAAAGVIVIGEDYDPADPAEAAYVGHPAHPNAPKAPISLPELAEALADLGQADLLVELGGGAWLLTRDVEVRASARLEVVGPSVSALRLDSTPSPGGGQALTRLVALGGHLLIEDVLVTSWDSTTATVDMNHLDGRSYLLALNGGRMDIIDAEVAYLGWADGEPSGLAWRKRGTETSPETGATGSIIGSNIHHNYFGQYSYEAYGLKILDSEVHSNIYYGIDPHDYSSQFEVAHNKVYNNGRHGIIFSRGCENNVIRNNEVYGNAEHGIMLDRGTNNNLIADNLVYNNRDGIAIFQSSDNLIQNNTLRDNERGVRINATYDSNDIYDGGATGNTIAGNTIVDNSQYGIYLYRRADSTIISGNTISGNAFHGIYIKTGGNQIAQNIISGNGNGISIFVEEPQVFPPGGPTPVPAAQQPAHNNVIEQNTIENNSGIGVQVRGGSGNRIGPHDPQATPARGNLIRANGSYGIRLSHGASDNAVRGNQIFGNESHGVQVRDPNSQRNQISQNSIAANGGDGIDVEGGANGGIVPPTISSLPNATTVAGSTAPGARVEIYRDQQGEGRFSKGATTADGAGAWSFVLPAGDDPAEGWISVLAISPEGNSSAFASNAPFSTQPTYEVGAGRNGELTVFVSGNGSLVTIPAMQAALKTISPTVQLIENQGNGVWQANATIFVNRGVTLEVSPASGVSWLKLRSQRDAIQLSADDAAYNYQSFVYIRTHNGILKFKDVRITSWDPELNDYDRDISNGRSYLLAKYDSRMDFLNAEASYLGSADGESYGIAWRDTNDTETPDVLRTRVTGDVIDSVFSHNYYGIYTYQASNMVFRGNQFHNNIGYGFDPHDFSNNFLVEDNQAFENGNHGFIISRGCNNFIFRNNRSYNNRYAVDDKDRNAHGFMLDPGSPNSRYPQEPSFDNLLENNQAWGNDGYGLRVLGSNNNVIRNNEFRDNLQGITLEQQSGDNLVEGNTISGNGLYGIYLISGSDNNTLRANIIGKNGIHGIYIKTGGNQVVGNTLTGNGTSNGGEARGAGIAFLPDTAETALADLVPPGGSLSSVDPELQSDVSLASALAGNQIADNQVIANVTHGIEVKGAAGTTISGNQMLRNRENGVYLTDYQGIGTTGTLVSNNLLLNNGGRGIRSNGAQSSGNVWQQNSVSGNAEGGIWNTSGANGSLKPPTIVSVSATSVSGTALPGALVEIYSDAGSQGRHFEGEVTADAQGNFQLNTTGWQAPNINAFMTAANQGSSGFSIDQPETVTAPEPGSEPEPEPELEIRDIFLPLVYR